MNRRLGIASGALLAAGNLGPAAANAAPEYSPAQAADGQLSAAPHEGIADSHLTVPPALLRAYRTESGRIALTLPSIGGSVLENASPDLSSNRRKADRQLDAVLAAEGPDSCLASEIAQSLGLRSVAARVRYVTAANIRLVKEVAAPASTYRAEIGCSDEAPVKTLNRHGRSTAYQLAAERLPRGTARFARKTGDGYVARHAVLRPAGGNVLTAADGRLPKHSIAPSIDADVGYGVLQAVRRYAARATNTINESGVVCVNGNNPATAQILAISDAVTSAENQHFSVTGRHVSFAGFQARVRRHITDTQAAVKAAADQAKDQVCNETSSPVPGVPAPPSPVPGPAPTPAPPVSPAPYTSGEVGADVSWPNCEASVPADSQFGIVGVTYGLGYSTNPCLQQEAAQFSDLSLYVNTGWNSSSVHATGQSPRVCAPDDGPCRAYDYGYNAGEYAFNAAQALGVTSTRWWLDVEDDATWGDPLENRQSLQGEHDALVAHGATTVGVYSTTALWNSITGSWHNNWPSWGATTWPTAAEAATYCEGHQFTGPDGPSLLMQYQDGSGIDRDVAC